MLTKVYEKTLTLVPDGTQGSLMNQVAYNGRVGWEPLKMVHVSRDRGGTRAGWVESALLVAVRFLPAASARPCFGARSGSLLVSPPLTLTEL